MVDIHDPTAERITALCDYTKVIYRWPHTGRANRRGPLRRTIRTVRPWPRPTNRPMHAIWHAATLSPFPGIRIPQTIWFVGCVARTSNFLY